MLNILKNILNGLDASIYVTDMETDEILFVNQKCKDTFGIDTATGKKCWQVIQKGFSERCPFCPVFKLERDPGTPVVWEAYNTVTGRYYKNTDSVIDWVDGRKVHLQYAIDMTNIKAAQAEAANMLGILKNILNGMDAYVYVSDMKTDRILFINNRMKEAFGLGEEIVGKVCWKVLQDGFTERCSFCPNFTLEKNPNERVVWTEHNTVTKRHYKNVDSVINWMDGKKVHMQHSTDITDIVEAQEEIQAATERLEIALNSSQAGVWEICFETNQVSYDAIFAKLFMLEPKKGTMSVAELSDYLEKTMQRGSGAKTVEDLRTGEAYPDASYRDLHFIFSDGVERYVRDYGNTIRDEHGKVRRAIGMCIDITPHVTMEKDLKAAKETAEKASRAKSQFLSNMSHEIRTPMNAIIGMADILQSEDLTDRQRGYVSDIQMSSTALLGIINDILDFSKIEAGKLQLVNVDYDLRELLFNIRSMFSLAARTKGIDFTMRVQDDLPVCLYGDDIRLRQVLINIIGNALKFTKEGGVTVSVEAADGWLRFTVSDTGIGIKAENLPYIFNDFARLDLRETRTIAGTGLGLSITKSLVDIMGGNIRVESEYGLGTSFYLEFPLVPGDLAKLGAGESEVYLFEAPEAKVLVVDDTEVNLHVAAGLLRLYGIACDTAESGPEAIRKIEKQHYDIVFMDHMMPEMDGVETTKRLRATRDMDSLVIIALTANAVEGVREMLINAKMNDYLSKPIDKAQLARMLRKWLPADKVREKETPAPRSAKEFELSPLLLKIAKIDGIDVELGLDRISWMQDVYETSVAILARRLPDGIERLNSFLNNNDLHGFSIEVHGLKGSLNNIGATELAGLAEALERRAKENDAPFCENNLPVLISAVSGLHEKLAAALEESASEAPPAPAGDKELLRRQLPIVRGLLDSFEGDEARALALSLSAYDYGAEINAVMKNVIGLIEEFEYERAMAEIDSL